MRIKNFQMYKLDFKKAEEPEIKLPTFTGPQEKQENSRRTSTSTSLTTYTKAFDCESQQTVENSERDGDTRPPYLPPEKPVCRSRSNSQNWTWNKLVQNWEGKEYIKAVYCHPAYLTYMQSAS